MKVIRKLLAIFCVTVLLIGGCSNSTSHAATVDSAGLKPSADSLSLTQTPEPSASISHTSSKTSANPSAKSSAVPSVNISSETSSGYTVSEYFTKKGVEDIRSDPKKGCWLYRSSNVYVNIQRVVNRKKVITYFVADIRLKKDSGATERAGISNTSKPGLSSLKVYQIARKYQAVVAVNGDYMHRVEAFRKGIIIRNGKIYLQNKNTDTLAFLPDGSLKIYKPGATTAKKLLNDGVKNTFSFGPTLVSGGKVCPGLNKLRLKTPNPRTAVGMIEPYHYLLVEVDGRQPGYSVGMTFVDLANVFTKYHCSVAYNLDGGKSSTMTFMGTNISRYGGSLTGQRKVPDALMFGTSARVPKK